MLKETPAPVKNTFRKYVLLYTAITVFGLIWGLLTKDSVLLLLSASIAALGAGRTMHLYKIISNRKYRMLEGIVISDTKHAMRRSHDLTLQLEDGTQIYETIAGKQLFKPMQEYQIYLYCSVQPDIARTLPKALRPAQILLGYELLEESFSKN